MDPKRILATAKALRKYTSFTNRYDEVWYDIDHAGILRAMIRVMLRHRSTCVEYLKSILEKKEYARLRRIRPAYLYLDHDGTGPQATLLYLKYGIETMPADDARSNRRPLDRFPAVPVKNSEDPGSLALHAKYEFLRTIAYYPIEYVIPYTGEYHWVLHMRAYRCYMALWRIVVMIRRVMKGRLPVEVTRYLIEFLVTWEEPVNKKRKRRHVDQLSCGWTSLETLA